MSSGASEHSRRLEQFKADLSALDFREIVRKHITTGMPAAIHEAEYYELRREVASHFELHPNAVILVGSCRLGFVLKPRKRWRPARKSADFDLALVSADRFDYYWDRVFHYAKSDLAWRKTHAFRRFAWHLFHGWIDPRGLPPVPKFEQAKAWVRFFDNLMRSRRFGPRRISARLYRTWDRLEAYQEIMVRSCANEKGA
jgi:hypothetical protein